MQIKMLTHSAGPDGHRTVGQIVEVDDSEGLLLVEGGFAEIVSCEVPVVETAQAKIDETVETADKPSVSKRRR